MNRRERRKAAAQAGHDARLDGAGFDEVWMTFGEAMWEKMLETGPQEAIEEVRFLAAKEGKTPAEFCNMQLMLDGKVLNDVRIHKRRQAN